MHNLLSRLYDALGVELDPDEPVLIINDTIAIYFDRRDEDTITLSCPIMGLPDDPETLKKILQINYHSPVRLSADSENAQVLALYWITESTDDDILPALELLINTVISIQEEFTTPKDINGQSSLSEVKQDTAAHLTRRSKMQ